MTFPVPISAMELYYFIRTNFILNAERRSGNAKTFIFVFTEMSKVR